jgi:peptidoglycan/LPS O-acetylase OafA/YrhL
LRTPQVVQAGEVRSASIESVRALAALAVLAGHVWIFSHPPQLWFDTFAHRLVYGGGFGVFVFFGLSGYLLFWPFARRYFGGGERIDLPAYARNRFLRIVPLYWIAVVVLLIVQNGGGRFEDWWRHLLFVQSMWRDSLNAVDGPLWSVAVEIQFYALLPLLAWGLAKTARGPPIGAAALIDALAADTGVLRPKHAT